MDQRRSPVRLSRAMPIDGSSSAPEQHHQVAAQDRRGPVPCMASKGPSGWLHKTAPSRSNATRPPFPERNAITRSPSTAGVPEQSRFFWITRPSGSTGRRVLDEEDAAIGADHADQRAPLAGFERGGEKSSGPS